MVDNTFVCARAYTPHTVVCIYPKEELDRSAKSSGTGHNSREGSLTLVHC